MQIRSPQPRNLQITLLLTMLLTPFAMGLGCLPGMVPLDFSAFEYRSFNIRPVVEISEATFTRLDSGFYQLDMTVKEIGGPLFFLCADPENLSEECVQERELPSRLLSDEELQRINEVLSSLETFEFVNESTSCPGFAAGQTVQWDDTRYSTSDGFCIIGTTTKLTQESWDALGALMENLR